MRNNATARRQIWRLVSAALGGVLLMAAAGCANFVPVQNPVASGGSVTICGQAVSGSYVRFYPPTQTPNTGDIGFRGYLWNVTAGAAIANTDYLLQWFVTSANTGCCTTVSGSSTDVSCPVTAGLVYRFTAHFKTGHLPSGNPTIELRGAWTK